MKKSSIVSAVLYACLAMVLAPLANAQHQHAFIWDSANGMTDLGTLGGNVSQALGINDKGQVVGYSLLADNVTQHAFMWTATTGMRDLGVLPGGNNTFAWAVNSRGQVAGEGLDANHVQVPFFWSSAIG